MGNRPDAHEDVLFELTAIRRDHITLAMRDQVMCAQERQVIDRIDRLHHRVIDIKTRKAFAGLIEKGGDVSAYMNRLAAPLNMQVISLDDVRESRSKIVPFPVRDDDFGA